MPVIHLETFIQAPVQVCFDLSRSIDLHQVSTAGTGEKAIAGRTSGLIVAGETVTWRAKHFGIWQQLTVKIVEMKAPVFFADEMVKGTFRSFRHEHHFAEKDGGTLMKDVFDFEAPLGLLGKLAARLVLTRYMTKFLVERNDVIKDFAESGRWRELF